jgi:hypothetical protein
LNLVERIAGAARLLATGKLAHSTGFDGAQMQRRLVARRAGGEAERFLPAMSKLAGTFSSSRTYSPITRPRRRRKPSPI